MHFSSLSLCNQSYDPLWMIRSSSSAPFRSECNIATTTNVKAILSSCIKNAESQHLFYTMVLIICLDPWLWCYFIRINDSVFLSNMRYNLQGSFKRLIFVCELQWTATDTLMISKTQWGIDSWQQPAKAETWPRRRITVAQTCRKNRNVIRPSRLQNWQRCLLEWSSGRWVWKKEGVTTHLQPME